MLSSLRRLGQRVQALSPRKRGVIFLIGSLIAALLELFTVLVFDEIHSAPIALFVICFFGGLWLIITGKGFGKK